MKPKMTLNESQTKALLESIGILSLSLWGPNPESCARLFDESYFKPLEVLGGLLGEKYDEMVCRIRALPMQFQNSQDLQVSMDELYIRLFIVNKEGINTPLFHSCYGLEGTKVGGALMGEPAMKMQAYFGEVGMALDESINEPPDHLAIELEYLYFLLEKWQKNRQDDFLNRASQYARTFMLPWVVELDRRLTVDAMDSFYPLLVSILVFILELVAGLENRSTNIR